MNAVGIVAGGPFLAGDGRSVRKLTPGVTTEILGEGYTSAHQQSLTRRPGRVGNGGARNRAEVEKPTSYCESLCEQATPQGVLLGALSSATNQRWSRQRLAQVVADTKKDWLDAVMDLLLADRQNIGTTYFLMNEDNVKLILMQPWIIVGTDAGGMNPDGTKGSSHPRAYGTYPRLLGQYVRDERVLSLEDAIRKTSIHEISPAALYQAW